MREATYRPDGSVIWHPGDKTWLMAERDIVVKGPTAELKTLQLYDQSGTETGKPKKPLPQYPVEAHQDPEKFKNVDYMAAVRDKCKGEDHFWMR
jgi:hypothetical protein